jgi:hypothetical protein
VAHARRTLLDDNEPAIVNLMDGAVEAQAR